MFYWSKTSCLTPALSFGEGVALQVLSEGEDLGGVGFIIFVP
jgi:hypothetical protein